MDPNFNLKQKVHIAAMLAATQIEWGLKPEAYAIAMRAAFDGSGFPSADYEYFRNVVTETRGRLNSLAIHKAASEFAGAIPDPLKVPKGATVEAPTSATAAA